MKVDILEGLDPNRPRNSSDHLLVRELTHRINNEFASVIGRASLFAARSTNHEVKKALAAITRIFTAVRTFIAPSKCQRTERPSMYPSIFVHSVNRLRARDWTI